MGLPCQEARRLLAAGEAVALALFVLPATGDVRIALMTDRKTVLTASGESKTSATSASRMIGGRPLNFRSMPAKRLGFQVLKSKS